MRQPRRQFGRDAHRPLAAPIASSRARSKLREDESCDTNGQGENKREKAASTRRTLLDFSLLIEGSKNNRRFAQSTRENRGNKRNSSRQLPKSAPARAHCGRAQICVCFQLEVERNMFGDQLACTLKLMAGKVGGGGGNIEPAVSAFELGNQLDEIRKKYGGLRLQ